MNTIRRKLTTFQYQLLLQQIKDNFIKIIVVAKKNFIKKSSLHNGKNKENVKFQTV